MPLDEIKNIATIIGSLSAVLAFLKGIIEYIKQGSQRRAEYFNIMRKKLKENEVFKNICALLETDDKEITNISFGDKRDFLGFFEEIALMMNSKIIKEKVAHYMFGYYALRCWKSKYFWIDVNRESIYWCLFKDFVKTMEKIEKKYKFKNSKYKF